MMELVKLVPMNWPKTLSRIYNFFKFAVAWVRCKIWNNWVFLKKHLMLHFSFLWNNHNYTFPAGDMISHTVQKLPLGLHFTPDKAQVLLQCMWISVCESAAYNAIDYSASRSLQIIDGSSHYKNIEGFLKIWDWNGPVEVFHFPLAITGNDIHNPFHRQIKFYVN